MATKIKEKKPRSCKSPNCDRVFFVLPRETRKFCNRECYNDWRSSPEGRKELSNNVKIYDETRKCKNPCCDRIISFTPGYDRKFCSRDCYFEWKKIENGVRVFITRKCECNRDDCDKQIRVCIYPKNKYQRRFYIGHGAKKEGVGEKISDSLSKFYSHGGENPMLGKNHSLETIEKMRWKKLGKYDGKNNPNWRGGTGNEPYPFKFDRDLKEYIRNRDDNVCQRCGKTKEEEGRNLTVHHINYDKEDLFDLNLITLCNRCNCIVNGNRDFWEDYFTFFLIYGKVIGVGGDDYK